MLELNIYNKNIISKFWFLKAYFISYNIFKNGEIVKTLKFNIIGQVWIKN